MGAAVTRTIKAHVEHVDGIHLLRVGHDVHEIPGPLPQTVIFVDQPPVLAGIVGDIETALLGFDQGVDALGIGPDGQPDSAQNPFGQAVAAQRPPGLALVGGFVDVAARAAAGQIPGQPPHLIERCVEDARIMRVGHQIDRPGVGIPVEHLLPGVPAIGAPKDAPLLVGARGVSHGGHQNHVGIVRIHDDLRDMARILETDVHPGLATVHGFVDTVAVGDIAAQARLAGTHIDDVGIGRRDRNRADGLRGLIVKQGLPVLAAIDGFPDTAGDRTEIKDAGLPDHARDGLYPTAPERPDQTPLQSGQRLAINLLCGSRNSQKHNQSQPQFPLRYARRPTAHGIPPVAGRKRLPILPGFSPSARPGGHRAGAFRRIKSQPRHRILERSA